jgi:hypothetical protein
MGCGRLYLFDSFMETSYLSEGNAFGESQMQVGGKCCFDFEVAAAAFLYGLDFFDHRNAETVPRLFPKGTGQDVEGE